MLDDADTGRVFPYTTGVLADWGRCLRGFFDDVGLLEALLYESDVDGRATAAVLLTIPS